MIHVGCRWLGALVLCLMLAAGARADQGDCGQPITSGSSPTASDALAILRAAVGTSTCDLCVCDIDASGAIVASDALATLRRAVGQQVSLACLACRVTVEITAQGGEITSADDRITIVFPAGAVAQPTSVSIEGVPLSVLPPPVDGSEEGHAYDFAPDDLALATPAEVRARFDAEPDENGLGSFIGIVLRVAGDALEVLPGQALLLDADAGEQTASAEIDVLTQLGVFPVDLRVTVGGVPDSAVVDAVHELTVEVVDDDEVLAITSASYTDDDFGVWQPSDGAIVERPLTASDGVFSGSFDYECTGAAQVFYRPVIDLVYDVDAGPLQQPDVAHRTTLQKTVTCTP